jgi:hypothetical protein
MNPPATQSQPAPLDDLTLTVMIQATMDSLPHPPGASADEQAARRHAAFTIFSTLRPRGALDAMLVARIAAAQFYITDDLRCAAQPDLASNLKLRHRKSATGLDRMMEAARRELSRLQALPARQPAVLAVSIPAPRVQPVPAAAPEVAAQQAVPRSRQVAAAGGQRLAAAAAPHPATGGFVFPTDAEIARLVAETEALIDAKAGRANDAHERLVAETASRVAASATALGV